jgi:hypothetical protein
MDMIRQGWSMRLFEASQQLIDDVIEDGAEAKRHVRDVSAALVS